MADRDPRTAEELLPLKPVVFRIILLLLEKDCHGYGIVKELTRQKPPGLSLFPASLYRTLRRMVADGLIAAGKPTRAQSREGKARVYFGITSFGKRVAHAEAKRLDALVGSARSLRLLAEGDSSGGEVVS